MVPPAWNLEAGSWNGDWAAGSDFSRGPETFTTARHATVGGWTQVDSVPADGSVAGEKTNGSGDATHANLNRGGTPQHLSVSETGCPISVSSFEFKVPSRKPDSHQIETGNYFDTKPGEALNAFTVLPSLTFHTTTPPS